MCVERMWRAHDLKPSYDVVIIGAGVHGLAIAYYLGQRGIANVAVLDKGYLGGGASGRNTAIIRLDRAVLEVAFNWNEVRVSLPDEPYVAGGPVVHALKPDAAQDYLTELADQMQDWIDAIREGRPPFVDPRSVVPSIELMETCYRRRQPLVFPWDCPEVSRTPVLQ